MSDENSDSSGSSLQNSSFHRNPRGLKSMVSSSELNKKSDDKNRMDSMLMGDAVLSLHHQQSSEVSDHRKQITFTTSFKQSKSLNIVASDTNKFCFGEARPLMDQTEEAKLD